MHDDEGMLVPTLVKIGYNLHGVRADEGLMLNEGEWDLLESEETDDLLEDAEDMFWYWAEQERSEVIALLDEILNEELENIFRYCKPRQDEFPWGRMYVADVEEGLWDLKEALMTRDAHTLSETVYFSPAFDAVHRETLRFGDEEGVEVCRNIVERLDVITLNQAFRRLVQKLERFVP